MRLDTITVQFRIKGGDRRDLQESRLRGGAVAATHGEGPCLYDSERVCCREGLDTVAIVWRVFVFQVGMNEPIPDVLPPPVPRTPSALADHGVTVRVFLDVELKYVTEMVGVRFAVTA